MYRIGVARRVLIVITCIALGGCISNTSVKRGDEVKTQIEIGEEALGREDFDAAARAFDAAFRASGDARLKNRAAFASSMSAARRAIEQRSFEAAAAALRAAINTREDRGAARALLDAVEPRVYRIRLESVAIAQTKPGTNQPWVGKPWWRDVAPVGAAAVATWVAGPKAGKVAHDLTAVVTDVPPENRPSLVTFIELPDGRRLKTQTVKGIFVIYGAELVLYTNKYDSRAVRLAVFHERSGGNESVAVANVPLGQIVSGKIDKTSIRGEAQALQQVVFSVDPAEAWEDGGVANVELQDQQENRASARSLPARSSSRVQLASASLSMPTDGRDGHGGNPDPYFEIAQGRRQIFKSVTMQNSRSAGWSFTSTDLFLDSGEEIAIKLKDADVVSDDSIASWTVSARELLAGRVALTTAKGTSLILTTMARSERPR